MPQVVLYSRRACGLCDEARESLLAVRAQIPFELEEIFIDGDADLERAYGVRVPVVLVGGEEAFEIHVDEEALRDLLEGA